MRSSSEYRARAWEKLSNNWMESAGVTLIVVAVALLCNLFGVLGEWTGKEWLSDGGGVLGNVMSILLALPLNLALNILFLQFIRGNRSFSFENLMEPVRNDYPTLLSTGLMMQFLVVMGGVFTFGILTVVLGLAYSMVPYLLNDYPELNWREALRTSRQMMNGHKWELFLLDLSFLGWILLGLLTCGIGMLFVAPYMSAARAEFYEDLKAEMLVDENTIQDAQIVE